MQCIQCLKEFSPVKVNQKCCSPKCRLKHYRSNPAVSSEVPSAVSSAVSSPVNPAVSSAVSKPEKLSVPLSVPQPETAPENSAPDFSKYTADELYIGINSYERDLWAKSPEYKELIKRLNKLSIKQLHEQGFQIPLWKLNNQPCPF